MDLAPDYKTTPPSWKQNQLTQNRFDTVGRGGLLENSNHVSAPSHVSGLPAFKDHPQPLSASAQGADLSKSFDQAQTRITSRGPATVNGTPIRDSIASTVSGSKFFQPLAEITPPAPHQEMVPKVNTRVKHGTIAANANLLGKHPIPVTSTEETVAPHSDPLTESLQVDRETCVRWKVWRQKWSVKKSNPWQRRKDQTGVQTSFRSKEKEAFIWSSSCVQTWTIFAKRH